jgi:stage II sporulation protein D
MRRLTLPVALLMALACVAGASASPVFVLRGEGWGHGVGMSQYGALGRAQQGDGYKSILGFYYDGTTVGQTSQRRIKVLLEDNRSAVILHSSASFKVGAKTLAPFTDWKAVPTSDGRVRVIGKGKFGSPATVTPGQGFLRVDGLRYRGALKLWNDGGLDVVNVVGLQSYLFSVVPREMPADWLSEALKAQAVAARSYAVLADRDPMHHRYDIYDDTRDQVYGGLDYGGGEDARSTAAVKATAGEVVEYNGSVVSTYFSSSNGGRTAASADTWGGPQPYLLSKPDPLDLNSSNPNRSWTVVFSARALQQRLGAAERPLDGLVTDRISGRVNRIRLERGSWAHTYPSSVLGPEYFRSALGLRSSRFDLGVLRLTSNTHTSLCRARVHLDVIARDVRNAVLQRRPSSGGEWKAMELTKTGAGTYTAVDRPCRGIAYRLHSSAANTAVESVRVAPRILFSATQPAGAGALRGTVLPTSLAGQTVYVARKRKDGTWRRMATATVRSDGTWRASFDVVEGTYRARISPPASSGLIAGYSPPLVVKLS